MTAKNEAALVARNSKERTGRRAMRGPTDLTAGRARQHALPDMSSTTLAAFPHTDGDIANELGQLGDFLWLVDGYQESEIGCPPLPAPLRGREALDAIGRLANLVAAVERKPPAVQPIRPDGRFELVPLYFTDIDRRDRLRIAGAAHHLEAARRRRCHPAIWAAIEEWDEYRRSGPPDPITTAQRLTALLDPQSDNGLDTLHALLCRRASNSGRPTERLVLIIDEDLAYQRIASRIVRIWHRDDPLARFTYHGRG